LKSEPRTKLLNLFRCVVLAFIFLLMYTLIFASQKTQISDCV